MAAPAKLSIVVHSDSFDRVHNALVMASAAAAIGVAVTMFFTMGAVRALFADRGWRALERTPDGAEARDRALAALGIGGFEDLLAACRDLSVEMLVCEAGLKSVGAGSAALRDDVPLKIAGFVTLLAGAGEGQIVYV